MLILREPFKTEWADKDAFAEVEKLSGNTVRAMDTRRTLSFEFNGRNYYLKLHHGTTFGEVLKNLITLRLPIIGATNEWNAIHKLEELGVDTMKGVAFGQKGVNPITKTSFIITESLEPTISLEDFCASWAQTPPPLQMKRALIRHVSTMVRKMHQGGVNHRDCYLCHFLMETPVDLDHLRISLIDLHRAQIRNTVPTRWRDKDIIGLYFSSSKIGLTKYDYLLFLKTYFNLPLREIFKREKKLLSQIETKAERIRRRTEEKVMNHEPI